MDSWQTEEIVAEVARHRRALAGFTAAAEQVPDDAWSRPTPCTEWDAGELVEHVIGFHEFLLLRPLGVRAHRPRVGPLARWRATERAVGTVLDDPRTLDAAADYFDGARRRPRELLAALANDTVVHTWDLARAVDAPDRLAADLCALAYTDALRQTTGRKTSDLFAAAVTVSPDAPVQDRLLGLLGRDPAWRPASHAPSA